jgi:hypothetical protein
MKYSTGFKGTPYMEREEEKTNGIHVYSTVLPPYMYRGMISEKKCLGVNFMKSFNPSLHRKIYLTNTYYTISQKDKYVITLLF